jgi:hypothetical protein
MAVTFKSKTLWLRVQLPPGPFVCGELGPDWVPGHESWLHSWTPAAAALQLVVVLCDVWLLCARLLGWDFFPNDQYACLANNSLW